MSALTRDLNNPALVDDGKGSIFSQGLRSGGLNAGAGLSALAGTAADFVGAKDTAASMYDTSRGLRARGVAAAPEIQSVSQVNDVDSGLRYATGLAGQALPALGAGLLGAVVAKNPLVGATVASTPFTAGDIALRQQEDPTIAAQGAGQRLGQAVGVGALSAGLQNVVPVALGGKLVGRGVEQAAMGLGRNFATNVGEGVVGNAAAGALGEKLTQNSLTTLNAERDTSQDRQGLIDAAAGGAVIGTPFAAAGVLGQARFGKGAAPRTDGVALPGEAAPAAKPSIVDRLKGAFKKDDATLDAEAASTIAKGEDVIDREALRLAPPDKQGAMLDEADASRMDKVKAWAEKMAQDADLSPEVRAQVDAFMANPADRASQAGVAAAKMARDGADTALAKAKEFGEFVSKKFGQGDAPEGVKLSQEFSPKLHSAMADAIAPALAERFPALVQSDKNMQVVTRGLREIMGDMQKTGRLDGDTVEQLHGWFGDDAPSVMASLHSTVLDSGDTAATSKYFGALNSMTDEMAGARSLESAFKESLDPKMQAQATPDTIRSMVKDLRARMDEMNDTSMSPEVTKFKVRELQDAAQVAFGKNTDKVLRMFEGDSKKRKSKTDEAMLQDSVADLRDGARDEFGERISADDDAPDVVDRNSNMSERAVADEVASKYLGGGKDKKAPALLRDPDAHRAEFGNESQAERMMKQARAKNPDAMVDFVRIKDLPDEERAKYPDAKPDEGLVVVEGTRDETTLTDVEMKSFTIDTHNKTAYAANNKSRVDTGVQGAVIDARAMVKAMKRKLDYTASDDHGNRNRTARAFMEGIAAVQDRLGKTFEIPDSTVLEPGFTYGDAKKLTMRKPDPAWMKGKTDEEINKSLARKESLKDLSDEKLADALEKSKEIQEKREFAFKEEASKRRLDKAAYRELRKQMGVDDAKDAVFLATREIENREMVPNQTLLDDAGRMEFDPNENITLAAKGENPARKVGFDDAPLAYDNFITPSRDGKLPRAMLGAIESRINQLENANPKKGTTPNAIALRVAAKARELLAQVDKMTNVDRAMLVSITKDEKVTSIAETVNELHAKYAGKEQTTEATPAPRMNAEQRRAFADIAKAVDMSSGDLKMKAERLFAKYKGKSAEAFTRALAAQLGKPESALKGVHDLLGGTAAKKPSAFVERVLGEGDLTSTIKAIKDSADAKAVQRAVDALAEHADNPRAREVLDAANEKIAKMIEADPDLAYSMQRTNPNVTHTSKLLKDVEGYVQKVLGGRVDIEFKKMLESGSFGKDAARKLTPGLNEAVIRVSVHAMDPMGTAHHESLHAFFSELRAAGIADDASALMRAADSFNVKRQLRDLLKNDPDALKQVETSLEERAAYMYQFWAAGKLELGGPPKTVLGKLRDMFLKAMGMWTNDERAVNIMSYFQSGTYAKEAGNIDTVRGALRAGLNERVEGFKQIAAPLSKLAYATFATGNGRLRASMIPALMELADKVYTPLQGEHGDAGYVPAARVKHSQVLNELATKLSSASEEVIADALDSLQKGTKGNSPEERIVMRHVQKTLREMHGYMTEAGVKINDLGEDYFPRVWDAETIRAQEPAFREMLERYKTKGMFGGSVDEVIAALTRTDGSELMQPTIKPGMQFSKERILGFISGLDAEPFLQKDMFRTLNSYISQATRRAEWARRFDDDGARLKALMERAKEEGARPDDLAMAAEYLQGVDGTLGDTINPKLRRAFGTMVVYQNVRLLPLMIFSSLIDPGGVLVRGGTVGEAFNTLKRGLSEIPKGFKKNAVHDEWTMLADQMGVIESSVLMKSLGSSFAQGLSGDTGRKINDAFFKYNLMSQYNTSMRVGATEAAVGFLARHADGKASPHSARWLAELGFKPGDITVKNGRPLLTVADFKAAGQSDKAAQASADRMAVAVNKWVDGAVLRPTASHKPIWMNDPHFTLISHLKQFTYAFQETILKRTINEARYGNMAPAYALASYVPFMIAADLMKGMVVGGGSQPDYKEGWGLEDYVGAGVQRAGLLGVSQIGVDVATNIRRGGLGIGAVAGPALEQLGDAVETAAGPQQFKTFAMNAMPANQLFDAAGEALGPSDPAL